MDGIRIGDGSGRALVQIGDLCYQWPQFPDGGIEEVNQDRRCFRFWRSICTKTGQQQRGGVAV